MSSSSNNKNNTKQQSVAEQEKKDDINKIVNFLSKYDKEKKLYEEAIIRDLYSESGIRLKKETKTWPRLKTTEERIWEKFMTTVCDVSTGTFWPQRDAQGNIIAKKDGRPNCDYYVHTIIRYRTVSGEEFLFSQGNVIGYDAAGQEIREFISKPEAFQMTIFDIQKVYDQETKTFYETCKGVRETYDEYELKYTPENIQLLYEKRDKSRKAQPFNFIVRDEQLGMDVTVRWSSVQDTLKLFKEKEFDFLFNGNYIPTAIKEEMRIRTDALTGDENMRPNKIDPATNPNNLGYTLTSNYRTAKWLLEENINQEGVGRYHDKNTDYIG